MPALVSQQIILSQCIMLSQRIMLSSIDCYVCSVVQMHYVVYYAALLSQWIMLSQCVILSNLLYHLLCPNVLCCPKYFVAVS